jgi:hypothetical protein
MPTQRRAFLSQVEVLHGRRRRRRKRNKNSERRKKLRDRRSTGSRDSSKSEEVMGVRVRKTATITPMRTQLSLPHSTEKKFSSLMNKLLSKSYTHSNLTS